MHLQNTKYGKINRNKIMDNNIALKVFHPNVLTKRWPGKAYHHGNRAYGQEQCRLLIYNQYQTADYQSNG